MELVNNRVTRVYIGGLLLEQFEGAAEPRDGNFPERWICSTVQAPDGTGLSRTADGRLLRDIAGEVDVLVKLLDSSTRLILQVHPTKAQSQQYLGLNFGKTEAWYILDTRPGYDACVFLGFKPGITKQHWRHLFDTQDIAGMENAMHKIPVAKGDTFFVPSGTPHAMGPGVFFAEVQEPSDITFRLERKSPAGTLLTDEEMHRGAGFDAMFECFDYTGRTLDETLAAYKVPPRGRFVLPFEVSGLFSIEKIEVTDEETVPVKGYAIALALNGAQQGREFFLQEDTTFTGPQTLLVFRGQRQG